MRIGRYTIRFRSPIEVRRGPVPSQIDDAFREIMAEKARQRFLSGGHPISGADSIDASIDPRFWTGGVPIE